MDGSARRDLSGPRRALFALTWTVSVVGGLAVTALAIAGLSEVFDAEGSATDFSAFLMMAALVVASELRPIVMTRYAGDPVSISQAFAFAALYIWGWEPAVLLMAVGMLIGELVERKAWWKLLFNVGQYALLVFLAYGVLWVGATHLDLAVGAPWGEGLSLQGMAWVFLSWLVYHFVNLALVANLSDSGSWWDDFTYEFWFFTNSTMAVLALSPLIAVVATAYEESWLLLPLLMLPLLAVQRTAQMAQEREHRALHDPLTGLPNRLLLTDRIETALARATRASGRVVVIFLDLDLFKTVNEGLGHAVGDDLLQQVSDRLAAVLRPGDTLARFSGDEFAIVCEGIPDREVEEVPARIQAALAPPFHFEAHEVMVTASIGVATATPHSTAHSLLREADSAMYRAKSAGRDQVAHFHWTMHRAARASLDHQHGLRRALERDELCAHFQPVISLSTGEVVGLESLIRWEHPDRGLLGPDQFVPLAEETGLIVPVGAWMLDHAVHQLGRWRESLPGATDLWIAVNLSPRQLADPTLVDRIRCSLDDAGVPASHLHLEITETAVMRSADQPTATLEALRALGVHLIIDDFGTGYSSLARLKELPVTTLKIDRAFIDGLDRDSSDRSIVDAIAHMAHSLDLAIIAEGVESPRQLQILRGLGAQMGQGFLWSPAIPADEVVAWIGQGLSAEDIARFRALLSEN